MPGKRSGRKGTKEMVSMRLEEKQHELLVKVKDHLHAGAPDTFRNLSDVLKVVMLLGIREALMLLNLKPELAATMADDKVRELLEPGEAKLAATKEHVQRLARYAHELELYVAHQQRAQDHLHAAANIALEAVAVVKVEGPTET